MATLPEDNGSATHASPPLSSRNLSPTRSQPSRPMTPFGELSRGMGTHFASDSKDRPEPEKGTPVPDRVLRGMQFAQASLFQMTPLHPTAKTGSETASTHTTVLDTPTASSKTSTASTSEAEAEDATPAPAETSSPHPSTFDLPVRTGSNSDAHPAGDNSAPSHADKENKRKASASETDASPHKKTASSDAWLN